MELAQGLVAVLMRAGLIKIGESIDAVAGLIREVEIQPSTEPFVIVGECECGGIVSGGWSLLVRKETLEVLARFNSHACMACEKVTVYPGAKP